jgi:hypothetical protein
MKCRVIVVALLLVCFAAAQDAPLVLRGSWTASAGAQVLHGGWSAELLRQRPNAARGSWTLLGDAGQVQLQGTWSAQKNSTGWQGTWTAQSSRSQPLSGSWSAAAAQFSGRTLEDMLRTSLAKEISGAWTRGRLGGSWALRGVPSAIPR